MENVVIIAGLVIIGLGFILFLVGIYFAWSEFEHTKTLGPSKFVAALADLIRAIAGQPKSVILFTFGTLLIFLGGIIAGVSGLAV